MKIKLPPVLGLQRALVITDAKMKSVLESGETKDVLVYQHGIVGTQNVNTKKGLSLAAVNLQSLESAKLDPEARKMLVSFEIRGSDLANLISVCADGKERGQSNIAKKAIRSYIEKCKETGAIDLIAERYARNILNGRWLWRNKNYAISVNIKVTKKDLSSDTDELIADISAFDIPTQHFEDITPAEKRIAESISKNLSAEETSILYVEALVDFGTRSSIEVYPSQNYCDKEKNGIGRSLFKLPLADSSLKNSMGTGFKVVGRAAIRDQKIGNAIRTIDNWYNEFEDVGVILPVEPLGASKELNALMRVKNDNGFKIFEEIEDLDPTSKDGLFLLALLIRGGVFGSNE